VRIVVNGWFWHETTVGSGQYLAALAAVFPRVGAQHEFIVALPGTGLLSQSFPSGWGSHRVRTPLARLSANLAKVWFEQVSFPRLCRQLRADVALVPYWGSPWLRPCPIVVTVHDLIPRLLPLYLGGALQRLYTRLVSTTARRAAAVVTDSEASRRDIMAHLGVPAERVHAIHLAASVCDGDGAQDRTSMFRGRHRLPDGPFLLYLGGFDARKNVPRTIQGFAKFVRRCEAEGIRAPDLVVAGKLPAVSSDFAPDPRPLVNSLGIGDRVHFLGWVDEADKAALYRLATGVIFVSEYEGFGLPVLEAMACEGDDHSLAVNSGESLEAHRPA
jgi:glycosyltransferase involved in cell wall biosynthesis